MKRDLLLRRRGVSPHFVAGNAITLGGGLSHQPHALHFVSRDACAIHERVSQIGLPCRAPVGSGFPAQLPSLRRVLLAQAEEVQTERLVLRSGQLGQPQRLQSVPLGHAMAAHVARAEQALGFGVADFHAFATRGCAFRVLLCVAKGDSLGAVKHARSCLRSPLVSLSTWAQRMMMTCCR